MYRADLDGLTWVDDGSIYGTTLGAFNPLAGQPGEPNPGSVFKINADGSFKLLQDFSVPANGKNPISRVTIANGGNLYGTTFVGPDSVDRGAFYKISPDNTIQVTGLSASRSIGNLAAYPDGSFIRLLDPSNLNVGRFNKISANGVVTSVGTLLTPEGGNVSPYNGLVLGKDGNFYGTGYGDRTFVDINGLQVLTSLSVLFKFDANDAVSILHEFAPFITPQSQLYQDSAGNFYGTATFLKTPQSNSNPGVVYKVTPEGSYSVVHQFTDGGNAPNDPQGLNGPTAAPGDVIPVADGSLYGTTKLGGQFAHGVFYRIDPNGVHTVLHDYTATEGYPGSLTLGGDGNFYQLTDGGQFGKGAVYKINLADLAATTTSVGANPISAIFGQPVTLTASVSATNPQSPVPTGNVTFFDGTNSLGVASLNSGAASLQVSTLSVGSHSITAKYLGDQLNGASESSPVAVQVIPANTAPVAVNDLYRIIVKSGEKRLITIAAPGVLQNDRDTENDQLSIVGTTPTAPRSVKLACGNAKLYPNGSITYLPVRIDCKSSNFFNYQVTDGKLVSNPARVTINLIRK